jgi:hypothetical protein
MRESSHPGVTFPFPSRPNEFPFFALFRIWVLCLALPLLGESPPFSMDPVLESSLSRTGIPFLALVLDSPSQKGIFSKGTPFLENSTPFPEDSVLALGNLNDLFLRLWFFRMEAQGKIQLQTPLVRYFPEEPFLSIAPDLTLDDLLNSQAGLSFREDRFLLQGEHWVESWAELYTLETRILLERGDRSERTFLESVLLRELVTRISKESYKQTIQKDLFHPLGLSSFSFAPQKGKQRGSYSYFFLGLHSNPLSTRTKYLDNVLQVYGKLGDVQKILSVFTDPKSTFLTPEQKIRFFQPKTYFKNSTEKNYSYGFVKHSDSRGDVFLSSFFGEGSSSTLVFLPSQKSSLFLVTHSQSQPAIEQIGKNLGNVLLTGKEDGEISGIDEKIYSLLGVSFLLVSLVLLISNAVIVLQVISQPTIQEPKTVITGKFLISLGSFLGLVWFRFLVFPNLDSFSSLTVRFASTSFHGWKPEIYFGFLSLLVTSFLYVLTYALAISKYNTQITSQPKKRNATKHS